MNILELLTRLSRLRISLERDGDQLRCVPRKRLTAELIAALWKHKPELLEVLGLEWRATLATWPPEWRTTWQQHVDLVIQQDSVPRAEAEKVAFRELYFSLENEAARGSTSSAD